MSLVSTKGLGPWRLTDLLWLSLSSTAGGLILVISWFGVSGSVEESTQLRWLNAGVGGVVIAGGGNAVWLVTARRAVGDRLQRQLPALGLRMPDDVNVEVAESPRGVEQLVASTRMTRYHSASCPLVAGKAVLAMTRARHVKSGRRPCGVCSTPTSPGEVR